MAHHGTQVAHNVVRMVVNASDRAGVPLSEILDGIPVPEARLRRLTGGLEWEHFTLLVDRLCERVGYDRIEAIVAHIPDITPDDHVILSTFVSPLLLYRFICTLMGPAMYPMLECGYQELGDGTLYVSNKVRVGVSPCHNFFKLQAPSIAAIACFLGLPPAEVRAQTTARGGDYWINLPERRKLSRRVQSITQRLFSREVIRQLAEDKARILEANEQLWRARDTSFRRKLDESSMRWSLTDRHVEVLSGLARGQSNKELARDLGCSAKTIETHITEILRRAGCDSRLALVTAFWRDL
jgi:DNA-binding CsgD family transcriptional regulator